MNLEVTGAERILVSNLIFGVDLYQFCPAVVNKSTNVMVFSLDMTKLTLGDISLFGVDSRLGILEKFKSHGAKEVHLINELFGISSLAGSTAHPNRFRFRGAKANVR